MPSQLNSPYQKVDISSADMIQRVVGWSPPLAQFLKPKPLKDYFLPVAKWQPAGRFPYETTMRELIVAQVDKLYGAATALRVGRQLEKSFIAETGTHLSFPREKDREGGPAYDNTLVWQGLLASAALYKHTGLDYHMGMYASRVPIDNTNGSRYLQVLEDGFVSSVVSSSRASTISTFAEPLNDKKIAEVEAGVNEQLFQRRHKQAAQLLDTYLSTHPDDSGHLASWQTYISKDHQLSEKNLLTMTKIEDDLREAGVKVPTFEREATRLHQVKSLLESPLTRKSEYFGFSEQVAAVQSKLVNDVLPDDVQQIVVDWSLCAPSLMIKLLRDPQSLTHRIFADEALREKFVNDLGNIRTGWAVGETVDSPFVRQSKGTKLQRLSHEDMRDMYAPEKLANALEQNSIAPTCALEVMLCFMESGLLTHGGMFQGIYAEDIKEKLSTYLDGIGEKDRANAVRDMPVVVTQSPCFSVGYEGISTFSDFLRNPLTSEELHRIPELRCDKAIELAAPDLHDFFTYYESHLSGGCQELVSDESRLSHYHRMAAEGDVIVRSTPTSVQSPGTAVKPPLRFESVARKLSIRP